MDATWNDNFYYFTLYRALNGPEAVPGKESENLIDNEIYYSEADLSTWIREQNQSRKRFLEGKVSTITAHQIKVLDSVSFPWIRDSSERWDSHFRELVAYKEEHGHCNMPTKNSKLGTWVKNQRAAYHKLYNLATGRGGEGGDSNAKKTTAVITSDQIQLLSDLGFQWKVRNSPATAWNVHFERLQEFVKENGHCRVSTQEHRSLGHWLCEQRTLYRLKLKGERTRMTEERIARLESVDGFEWQGRYKKTEEEKAEAKKQRAEEEKKKRAEKKEERKKRKLEKAQEEAEKKKSEVGVKVKRRRRRRNANGVLEGPMDRAQVNHHVPNNAVSNDVKLAAANTSRLIAACAASAQLVLTGSTANEGAIARARAAAGYTFPAVLMEESGGKGEM